MKKRTQQALSTQRLSTLSLGHRGLCTMMVIGFLAWSSIPQVYAQSEEAGDDSPATESPATESPATESPAVGDDFDTETSTESSKPVAADAPAGESAITEPEVTPESTEAAEPEEQEASAVAEATPPLSAEPPSTRGKLLNRITRSREPARESLFGSYRVRVSMLRPNFTEMKFYDELYGQEKIYPELQADWYAFDWWATIGLSLRVGYYKASGHAAKEVNKPLDQVTEADLVEDSNGPTDLTLIPLQALITAEFTPFEQKWVVLEGWYGIEHLFFQESRTTKEDSTKTTAQRRSRSAGMLSMADATSTSSANDSQTLVNSGWKNAMVFGGAANILLNPLDERSARSMRGSMNIGYVYLSPFIEYVKAVSDGVPFSRTAMGIGFTFETVH